MHSALEKRELASTRFGYAWERYPQIAPGYEAQFRSWIEPLQPSDFAGKSVLDAGCGTGRNTYWSVKYGAKEVFAFDLDARVVEVARRNLGRTPNVSVFQSSIYDIEFENRFDIVFSIGVVHHLADPRRAMARLVRAARPGGVILVWVYAREGHSVLKRVINLLRVVTVRLPEGLLHYLTYPLSVIAYAYTRLSNHDHPYLRLFRNAPFWHVHSVVFDQLLPEISWYWSREEALSLFGGLPVEELGIRFTNEGSWTVWAYKRVAPAPSSA